MNSVLELISVLYGIMGCVYLCIAVRGILHKNEMSIFDIIRLMYSFAFGFAPCLVYYQEAQGARNLDFYDYSYSGLARIGLMLFFSILAFAVINLAYKSVHQKESSVRMPRDLNEEERYDISRRLFRSGVIALVIGWICLILWTRAYGSIENFIVNASLIRSGRGKVYNSLAFFKQFVRILPISLYAFVSAYCYEQPKRLKKIKYIIVFLISIVGNYYYFMASDSRVTIIYIGMAILMIYLRHRKKEKIGRYLFMTGVTIGILLFLTMFADTYTHYVRYGIWESNSTGIIDSLTKEFKFLCASDMKASKVWYEGNLHYKIGDDLVNAATSWIPERFIPFAIPDTVWTYNTNLFGSVSSGTLPSSLVSTSIYEFGMLGVVIFPFCFGIVAGYADKRLWKKSSVVYADVYYGLLVGIFVQMVSHNQISTFVMSMFPGFLFFIISYLCDRVRLNHNEER